MDMSQIKATIDFKVTKDNVATTVAPTEASTEAPNGNPNRSTYRKKTEKDTEYIPSNNKGNVPGFTKWIYPQGQQYRWKSRN